jgi:hypothetical protein
MAKKQRPATPRPAERTKPPAKRPVLGGLDVAVGLLLLGGIWIALPARWWPIDVFGSLLAVGFVGAGVGFILGQPWSRRAGLAVASVACAAGVALVTALAFTASYLSGLYGPVGSGGALLLIVVAVLIVPYLVVFPAAQLYALASDR